MKECQLIMGKSKNKTLSNNPIKGMQWLIWGTFKIAYSWAESKNKGFKLQKKSVHWTTSVNQELKPSLFSQWRFLRGLVWGFFCISCEQLRLLKEQVSDNWFKISLIRDFVPKKQTKMLVMCQRFSFYLGWSGSILKIRTDMIKVGSNSWLLSCSSNITLSLPSFTVSAL